MMIPADDFLTFVLIFAPFAGILGFIVGHRAGVLGERDRWRDRERKRREID